MKSHVTTKQGDEGESRALSGELLPKSHAVMECTGTLDELRAHTALARLLILEEKPTGHEELGETLLRVLHMYFLVGTECSDPLGRHPEYRHGEISGEHVAWLEQRQAELERELKLPRAFIASAGTRAAAQTDVACTVARRLERRIVALKEACQGFHAAALLQFANRLSDFLYIVARYVEGTNHIPVDYELLLPPGE